MPYRSQQSRLTLVIENRKLGVWDNKTGGDVDSNSTQYFLGGMGPRISLGGNQQTNNIVLQRLQDQVAEENKAFLLAQCGKGNGTFTEQGLDDDGQPFGPSLSYRVKLKHATPAPVDSQSANPKIFEVELEIQGAPTVS